MTESWGKGNVFFFVNFLLTISMANVTIGIIGPLLRGTAASELVPLRSGCALLPIDSHIWMLSGHTGTPARTKYQAVSKLTPAVGSGHFPTLALRNVPPTCWIRGLYGELLSRSARILVRESISASRLERLSSSVLPPGFTLKKKEEFQVTQTMAWNMLSYCPLRELPPCPSNNSQIAETNMLKCYSSLPESETSREAPPHKDLGCFGAFLHAFPTMVPLCWLEGLCNMVSNVLPRWAQRQWSCKLRPAPSHLHTYYYFESIHGSCTCLIQHFFTISITPLRSEKVQFISGKLKAKGVIWNKESQSNAMKVLGKRVIIQGSPWPEQTLT